MSSLMYLSIMYAGIPHLEAETLTLSGFNSSVALGKAMRKDYKVSATSKDLQIPILIYTSSYARADIQTIGSLRCTPCYS